MKRQIITFLLTMLMSMVGAMALAQTNVSNGSCFTAKTIEGVDVSYMITDVSQRTVQVGTSPSNQYWGSDNYASRVAVNTSSYGSVTIPEKVVYGGIEYSVTFIANGAFCGCSQLTDIIIPESVTHIGHAAFDHCTSLTSIYLPNSVTSIDDGYAFVDCTSLTNVRLSENLKVIPNDTFTRCSSLTTLTIPEGVTNLGKAVHYNKGDAFWKCSALTSVDIPSSVTYYVGNCFSECDNLKTVIVRRSEPVSIDNDAFENRKNSTLFVPKGCKTAYENAAVWKEFKEIIESSESVIDFADDNVKALCVAMWDTNGDGELDEKEAAAVTDLEQVFSEDKSITSFDELQYFTGVTSIGLNAFYNCSSLTSIVIPNSVTTIDDDAFKNCSGLTNVVIPNSVTNISGFAFFGCSGLTSICVASDNPKYDSRNDCNAIIESESNTLIIGCKNTTIQNTVTAIGYGAFSGCYNLTSIDIPNSVTAIRESAFQDCYSLTSVAIPSSVTSIGINGNAFWGCSGLTYISVASDNPKYDSRNNCNAIIETESNTLILGCENTIIPNTVTSIGLRAFFECSSLTSIDIPNSVTAIGSCAFWGCSSLTSIDIPNSVTNIGGSAFFGTAWYDNQPYGLVYAGKVVYGYKGTMPSNIGITLKAGTLGIADGAFSECSSLSSVTIPSSVISIGNNAFTDCSGLTNVTIGKSVNSVTSIGNSAFSGCTGLTSVEIPNSVKSIGDYAFSGCI